MKACLLVCDAGPLIVLAKLGVLTSWMSELGYDPVLLEAVVDEVKRGPFSYREEREFEEFLKQAKIVPFKEIQKGGGSLSIQDQASLSYAEKYPPAVLFADDRLLRRAAKQVAVPVIGFPGILIQIVQTGFVSREDAIQLLDQAIKLHNYRISISLYQELRKQMIHRSENGPK